MHLPLITIVKAPSPLGAFCVFESGLRFNGGEFNDAPAKVCFVPAICEADCALRVGFVPSDAIERKKTPWGCLFILYRCYEKDNFLRFVLRFRTPTEYGINERVESILIGKLEFDSITTA